VLPLHLTPAPQVKCWSPSGTPLVTSNHHNKQVCCGVLPWHTARSAGG